MNGLPEDRSQAIQAQLDKILASATFAGSDRHRQFLRFVVEQALKGETDKLNEFVLGFEVFKKGDSFDPRIDSIVRVEARRLRERLKKYYEDEGLGDPIVITLRPRSFVPQFDSPSAQAAVAAAPARTWRRTALYAGLAVAAIAVIAAAVLLTTRRLRPAPPQTVSIAVLPFQNMPASADQSSVGNAITDAIITGLANVSGLRIVPGSSQDLKADYVVSGTVEQKAGRFRVSAKMTDTRAQSLILADTRESDEKGLMELQRGLTNAIAARVRVPLPPGGGDMVMRRRPANPEAYGIFLKGQYYWYQSEPGSVAKSIALLEDATRRDPDYSPAWAWLANSYLLEILHDEGRDASLIARGRQAAAKALSLDDQLSEAHAAVGSYAALDWDWTATQREFRRAVQLNPLWAQGHIMYSLMYLVPTGQLHDALFEALRAHEIDPSSRMNRVMLAQVLYFNREYARAISECEDLFSPVSRASPGSPAYFLSLSLSGQGARALKEVTAVGTPPDGSPHQGLVGYLQAKNGESGAAKALLGKLEQPQAGVYVSPLTVAMVGVGLGDRELAFRQLRLAVERHIPGVIQVGVDPAFDPLRSDRQFAEILRPIGLPAHP